MSIKISENPTPHSVRIGRALNGLLDRRARGELVRDEDIRRDYHDIADELIEHLALLRCIGTGGPTIEGLIETGVLVAANGCEWPATLGEFRVFEVLGSGGMGVVLRAFDATIRRDVALKLLHESLRLDVRAAARMLREARALGLSEHPNIVSVYSVSHVGDRQFLVMEYVRGRELSRLLRDWGPPPLAVAIAITLQLLDALDAAHRAGVIHRDVKPSNILVECGDLSATPTWPIDSRLLRVRLTDFGLARLTSEATRMTQPDTFLGTPEHMSPEQARGSTDVDGRTDLYSVGVVLYELLTGVVPTKAPSLAATIQRILHGSWKSAAELSPGVDVALSGVATWLMQRDRNARPRSAREVMRVLRGERGVPNVSREGRWLRRALATLTVAAAGTAIGVALSRQAPRTRLEPIMYARLDPVVPHRLEIFRSDANGEQRGSTSVMVPRTLASNPVTLVDRDGDGQHDLVVLAGECFDDLHNCVIAYAANGQEVWRAGLSDQPIYDWPGEREVPETIWDATNVPLINIDLDGRAGSELVLVAHSRSYRRRITSMDASSGAVLQQFTHFGTIRSMTTMDGVLDDGRPALLVIGVNNKLDGWGDPAPVDGDSWRHTDYAKVAVFFVLDPRDMDGFGPPVCEHYSTTEQNDVRLVMQPARCVSYGYLNAPCDMTEYWCEGIAGSCIPDVAAPLAFREIEALSSGADGLVRLHVVHPSPGVGAAFESAIGWIDLHPRDLCVRFESFADQLPRARRPDLRAAFVPLVWQPPRSVFR